jgi:undecaprenyl-phosphate galactose phosphotransferase
MPAHELQYRFGSDAYKITSVRPGMTGLWQVSGRNDLTPEERRRLDLCYIETRSGLSDLKIILKTFYAVISGRGAY